MSRYSWCNPVSVSSLVQIIWKVSQRISTVGINKIFSCLLYVYAQVEYLSTLQKPELKRKKVFGCKKKSHTHLHKMEAGKITVLLIYNCLIQVLLNTFPVSFQNKIPVNWPKYLCMLILARFHISFKTGPVKNVETYCFCRLNDWLMPQSTRISKLYDGTIVVDQKFFMVQRDLYGPLITFCVGSCCYLFICLLGFVCFWIRLCTCTMPKLNHCPYVHWRSSLHWCRRPVPNCL